MNTTADTKENEMAEILFREIVDADLAIVVFQHREGFVVANERPGEELYLRYSESTLDFAIAAAKRAANGIRFDRQWMAR